MATDKTFEKVITGWLEAEAVTHLPDRTLLATFERTRATRQQRGWAARVASGSIGRYASVLAGAAAVVVVAVATVYVLSRQAGLVGPSATADPRSPFLGVWISTSDSDGGTQTMNVRASGNAAVGVVVTDTIASVCSLTPSTMTGTGHVEDGKKLVIPTPDYRCDDGSEPHLVNGDATPLNETLRNLTYTLDAVTGNLIVGTNEVWVREGGDAPNPNPQPSEQVGPASPTPQTSGGLWPQTTLEEVRQAQERADAGDPDFTWQVDPSLEQHLDDGGRSWMHLVESHPEVADRFLREVLGWDEYMVNVYPGRADANGAADGVFHDIGYLRCAPGDAKALEHSGVCAPTLDDLHYETVNIDLAQLDRQGPDGIWVVSNWRMTAPYAPVPEVTALVENFLQARIDGHGAEGLVYSDPATPAVPLLYATSTGAPYERYELERVQGPGAGGMGFNARLFADGGKTVVEQQIGWAYWSPEALVLDAPTTTENGQLVPVRYAFLDGKVSTFATYPWRSDCAGECLGWTSGAESGYVYLADVPLAVTNGCLAKAADPMPVQIGDIAALAIEGSGGAECLSFENWWGQGKPVRIYQIDLPIGSSMRTVAIVVVADGAPLDDVVTAATPIIESIEFRPD